MRKRLSNRFGSEFVTVTRRDTTIASNARIAIIRANIPQVIENTGQVVTQFVYSGYFNPPNNLIQTGDTITRSTGEKMNITDAPSAKDIEVSGVQHVLLEAQQR